MSHTVPNALTADERFLLHVIEGGARSLDERLERVENLRARDVITAGEAQRIATALRMGWGSS